MAVRYTGRHVRQARHGAWVNKKRSRSRPGQQLLPAAAALTVAGVLIGGAGAVIQFSPAGHSSELSARYDPANFPAPDPNALAGQPTRSESRRAQNIRSAQNMARSPANGAVIGNGACGVSYYAQGQRTANGEIFNPDGLTAAHIGLPFNSMVRVTNLSNGRSVVVRINDRGPYVDGRCLDLSRAAFAEIANLATGVIQVEYEVLPTDLTALTEDAT